MSLLPFIILQWNAQSILAHGNELKHYIYNSNNKPDIICIQESWLKENINYKLNNYSVIRKDRKFTRDGGVCVFVKNNITYKVKENDFVNNVEYIHIEIFINSKYFNLINIYHPGGKINKFEYSFLFAIKNVTICGDFNSKNTIWGSNITDSNGKIIQELMDENNLYILNDGTGTHITHNGNQTPLDLTFISSNLANIANWNLYNDTLGSDHFPVKIELYQNRNIIENNNKSNAWNYKKANWNLFSENLETVQNNRHINDDLEINEYWEIISNDIMNSANKYIPKKQKIMRNPVPYWNEKCTEAIRERKRARRKVLRTKLPQDYIEYKKKKALAQKIIKSSKKQFWHNYCSSLNKNSNFHKIWKTIMRMENNNNSSNNIPTIIIDNKEYITDNQKAEALANTFKLISSDENYEKLFLTKRQSFLTDNKNIKMKQNSSDSILDEDFNFQEFINTIKSLKNTAPGQDNITNEIIKHLSKSSLMVLLDFYNFSWKHGMVPDQWKLSTVIPIYKKGKDKHDTKSYRPISLTSNLGKIMERLVTKRLYWYLEKNHLINPFQNGFRKNKNTQEQLFRLQNNIRNALNNKLSVLTIFLDIEKAYDMLWKDGLLFKLQNQLKIGGKMYNWIADFLKNRKFQVRINETFSNKCNIENGTPQGSSISPLLFLIMINDINLSNRNVHLSLFADDIAIWVETKHLNNGINILQQSLQELQGWCDRWGFRFSINKTKAMIFKQNKTEQHINLKINNQNIEYVNHFKFLGLIFDNKFTWNEHINYVEDYCNKRINLLKFVSGTKWGANRSSLYKLYTALILSKIDYACEFYYSASQQNRYKLDCIQHKCLRLCTGAFKSTPIHILLITNKEKPLEIRRKELQTKFLYRIYNNDIFLDHTNIYWQNYYANQKFKDNLVNSVFKSVPRAELIMYYNDYNLHMQIIPIPPWNIPEISVNWDLLNQTDKIYSPLQTKMITREYIDSYSGYLNIFTDGSKQSNNSTASAVYIPYFNVQISKRIPDLCSIYTAELIALLLALGWIRDVKPSNSVIFTDSLSALAALQNPVEHIYNNAIIKEIVVILYELFSNQIKVIFNWIPSHIDIKENDKVDLLAKNACKNEMIQILVPLNRSEINREIHLKYQLIWETQYNTNNKGQFFKSIEPNVKNIQIINLQNKHMETILYRLRTGHNRLNMHLHKLGLHNSGLCDFCEEPETVKHYLLDCLKYQHLQESLIDFAVKNNVKLTVESILKNRDLFPVIYDYVLKTKREI